MRSKSCRFLTHSLDFERFKITIGPEKLIKADQSETTTCLLTTIWSIFKSYILTSVSYHLSDTCQTGQNESHCWYQADQRL